MPRVRVVIPTYNRAGLVAEALSSVLDQSYSDFEILVSDDGSDDNTLEVLNGFAVREPRVRPLALNHGGAAAARNAAIQASGEYEFVALLDSDDLWEPNHLRDCIHILETHPDLALISTAVSVIDHSGKWDESWQRDREERMRRPIRCASQSLPDDVYILDTGRLWNAMLASEFTLQPSTVIIRRHAVERQEWFNPQLRIFEDPELWLSLAKAGRRFAYIDRVHARIRHFGDNLTGTQEELGSRKVFDRYRSVLQFAHLKLAMCSNHEERRIVSSEVAWAAYLLGQSCAERGELSKAREYYSHALRYRISGLPLKGYLASWLPMPLFCWMRRLRTQGQCPKS